MDLKQLLQHDTSFSIIPLDSSHARQVEVGLIEFRSHAN